MIEAWMRADPLLALLIRRGDDSATAFEKAERVAIMVAEGADEIAAIEAVVGYVPHTERERIAMSEKPMAKI